MKRMIKFLVRVALVLIISFAYNLSLVAQSQPNLEVFENLYESAHFSTVQIEKKISSFREQIKERTDKVEEMKKRGEVNFLQQQKLERLLKESQELSEQVRVLETKLISARAKREKAGNELVRLYESELNSVLLQLNNKKTDKKKQEVLLVKTEAFRGKIKQVKQTIGMESLRDIEVNKLEISPLDSPKKIEQKADLLKDQEEKLRRLSKEIEGRSAELEKELQLRTRMGELVTDLAFFDQQEEVISGSPTSDRSGIAGEFTDAVARQGQVDQSFESTFVGQKTFDFESLSLEQLELLIEQLKKKQERTTSRADSLSERAQTFYNMAESEKNK